VLFWSSSAAKCPSTAARARAHPTATNAPEAHVCRSPFVGRTNAASIMIGEKAAEMIAVDRGVKLSQFVGNEH
jgi:hypothetical protein